MVREVEDQDDGLAKIKNFISSYAYGNRKSRSKLRMCWLCTSKYQAHSFNQAWMILNNRFTH